MSDAHKHNEWMPLYVGHYLRDTARLTRDQHGAYLLLLFAYWTNGGAIAADDAQLAATARATRSEWRKLKPVIAPYFQERDGLWFNRRAERELTRARSFVEKKSRAGKAGAGMRWQTDADANGKHDGKRMADGMAKPWQTDAPIQEQEQEKERTDSLPGGGDPIPEGPMRPLPDDFPDQEARHWAEQHWLGKGRVDLCTLMDEEIAKFRDFNISQYKFSADWQATWRSWVRNAMNFAKAPRNGAAAPSTGGQPKIISILDGEE
jgi:uncharacterized protein YdaU (DUF1376 family)